MGDGFALGQLIDRLFAFSSTSCPSFDDRRRELSIHDSLAMYTSVANYRRMTHRIILSITSENNPKQWRQNAYSHTWEIGSSLNENRLYIRKKYIDRQKCSRQRSAAQSDRRMTSKNRESVESSAAWSRTISVHGNMRFEMHVKNVPHESKGLSLEVRGRTLSLNFENGSFLEFKLQHAQLPMGVWSEVKVLMHFRSHAFMGIEVFAEA